MKVMRLVDVLTWLFLVVGMLWLATGVAALGWLAGAVALTDLALMGVSVATARGWFR